MALKPYTGEVIGFKPYDGDVEPLEEPGLMQEGINAARSGFRLGRSYVRETAERGLDVLLDYARGGPDETYSGLKVTEGANLKKAQRIATAEKEAQRLDTPSQSTTQGLQEIGEAEGPLQAAKAIVTNPRAVAMTTAKSLGISTPSMAAGVVGAAAGGPAGAAAGVGGSSGMVEYEATMRDTLSEAGVDLTDPTQVFEALQNPELMDKAKDRAGKRGLAIGAFDALTAGLAGRLLAGARTLPSAARRAGGELGVQAGGGATGEAAGQIAADGSVKRWGDVGLEAAGEMPTALTEVPSNYRSAKDGLRRKEADRNLVQDDYRNIADQFGATITSLTRSAAKNRKVGGVAGSQHLTGTAGDFVVPDERKGDFLAEARARGYEAIDEGDHIHLELPSGKQGRAALENRRAARLEAVRQGLRRPGEAKVEDLVDEARAARGVELDRTTPKSDHSDLAERARAPERTVIESPAPAVRVSDSISRLKNELLDRLANQSLAQDTAPLPPGAPDPAPQLDTPAPTVPDIPATQSDPVSTPPASVANEVPDQIAPIAPEPAPIAPQPAPAPAPVAQAPAPPVAPVAPPAQPEPPRPSTQTVAEPSSWEVISQQATSVSRALGQRFNAEPGLRTGLTGDPNAQLAPDAVTEVKLNREQQKQVDRLGTILGRKVILIDIDAPNATGLGGLAVDNKHIFINVRGVQEMGFSLPAVIGHEFTHTLRTSGNPMLEELIKFAEARVNLSNAYAVRRLKSYAQFYDQLPISQRDKSGLVMEELVADFMGDLIADDQFWAELAAEQPSLFRRFIKHLISFLNELRGKAKSLGDQQAFHEIDQMRSKALEIMRAHLGRVREGEVDREPLQLREYKATKGKRNVGTPNLLEGFDRKSLVQDRAEKLSHAKFEEGDFNAAIDIAQRASPDYAAPLDIETPEQKAFFKDASKAVKQDDKAAVHFHGTASNISRFKPKQGDAIFMAERASFSGPYAAASMGYHTKKGRNDVLIDGVSMAEIMAEHKKGSVDYTFAELLQQAQGDPIRAMEMVPDYAYVDGPSYDIAYLDAETNDLVLDRLRDLAFIMEDQPNFVVTKPRSEVAGMQIIPLVTNAKNPWDYENPRHIKKLVEALRDKFGSLAEFKKALNTPHGLQDWSHVERALSNKHSNWTLVEDQGAGVPQLIRELGFDAYHVSEMMHKNIAVFDPKQVKSPFNAGPWGQRKPTAEEAASLGMTLEEAIAAQEDGHILLHMGNVLHRTFTNGLYDITGGRAQLERWFVDEFRDLREIQKAISQQHFGGRLPPDLDAHRNENLRHGAYQDENKRAKQKYIDPLGRILTKADATLEEFSDYLYWRHAPERDAYLRARLDPQLAAQVGPDELAGISPADARASIAALDPGKRRAFERAAKFVDGMRKFTLSRLVQSGQITQDHYNNLLNQYRHYVPFRGMPDGSDILNEIRSGRGLSMNANPLGKRATGRKSKPDNIIEHMMRDMDLALIGVQKQTVLDSLVKLIIAHPDKSLWDVQPVVAERKWVDGELRIVQTNGEPKDQITFMHYGIPIRIEIRHEELKKALANMNIEPLPQLVRFVGRVTRWLSAVKTSFSPFFLLINPVRDAGMASMAILAEHDMATAKAVAKFYPHAWGALRRDDDHLKVAPHLDPIKRQMEIYAREFASIGGKTGYTYVNDIREQQRKLNKLIARHAKTKGVADIAKGNFHTKDAALIARKMQQRIANTFEVVNDMAENGTRLAVYAAMREKGMTMQEAAAYAKEVTVNFNRRGAMNKYLGTLYMFFNAAMQGSVRMAKLTVGNRKFQAMMGGLFASSYAMALGQMFAAGDDDDGESNYDKAISNAQSERSIGVYLGGGKSLPLPVPYGPNIFSYMGYRIARWHYDLLRGRDHDEGKMVGDIIAQMVTSMSPVDPGRGWQAMYPEPIRIFSQAGNNRNDFGGKLNYKLMGNKEEKLLPLHIQTDVKTEAPYRWAAAALNTMTGGNKYNGGAINWTGEQTKYVAEQWGGGMLRLGDESFKLVQNMLAGIDPEPSDVPLANVYFRGKGDARHQGTYYENVEQYEKTVAQWRHAVETGDEKAINAILKKAPWVDGAELSASTTDGREAQAGTMMEAARDIEREIKALRKEQREIQADKTLDWRERKRLAREIDKDIYLLQKEFNYEFNLARGNLAAAQ